jgi:hypothetical protein
MLPPLFLDVQPHHKVNLSVTSILSKLSTIARQVVDMCAAPGSKVNDFAISVWQSLTDLRQHNSWKLYIRRTLRPQLPLPRDF